MLQVVSQSGCFGGVVCASSFQGDIVVGSWCLRFLGDIKHKNRLKGVYSCVGQIARHRVIPIRLGLRRDDRTHQQEGHP